MASKDKLFEKTSTCRNCGSENIENYCSNCGQKVYIKRFTLKAFLGVFLDAFDIEKGFIHTFIQLFTKPGIVINNYIKGKTKSYFNPLKYVIIIAGVYAFLVISTDFFDQSIKTANEIMLKNNEQFQNLEDKDEVLQKQNQWMELYKKYINLLPLLLIPIISLASKWIYKSKKYFYGEHLIINSYILAHSFVLIILVVPLIIFLPSITKYFPLLVGVLTVIYIIYAYNKTFNGSPIISLIKSIFVLLIGYILFIIALILIMIIALFILYAIDSPLSVI